MGLKLYLEKLAAGEQLQESESLEAMQQIIDGVVSESQVGAFLMGLACRPIAGEELAGFVKCLKSKATMIKPKVEPVLDTCGTGGDRANTFNISTTAAFIAAGAGAYIAKHGNRAITSSCGSADVLEALGANVTLTKDEAAQILDEVGITFFFAPEFHPTLKKIAPLRLQLEIRSVFNILGPLVNPADARHHLIGVYDKKLCLPVAEALHLLGSVRAIVVHNEEGMDELGLKGENSIVQLEGGKVVATTFKATELKLPEKGVRELAGGDPAANAQTLRFILEGKEKGPKRDVALLNAAFALVAAGLAPSPEEGLKQAIEALDQGKAAEKLSRFLEAAKAVKAA